MRHFPFPLYLNTQTWCLTDGDCADALLGVPIKYTTQIQTEGYFPPPRFFFFFGVVNSIIIAVTSFSQRNLPFVLRIKLGRRRKRREKKESESKGNIWEKTHRSVQALQQTAFVCQEPVQTGLLGSNSSTHTVFCISYVLLPFSRPS